MATDIGCNALFQLFDSVNNINCFLRIHDQTCRVYDLSDRDLSARSPFYRDDFFDFSDEEIEICDILTIAYAELAKAIDQLLSGSQGRKCSKAGKSRISVLEISFAQLSGLLNALSSVSFKYDYTLFVSQQGSETNQTGFKLVPGVFISNTAHIRASDTELCLHPEYYDLRYPEFWERTFLETQKEFVKSTIEYHCTSLFDICYAIIDYALRRKIMMKRCRCGKFFYTNGKVKYCSVRCSKDAKAAQMRTYRLNEIKREREQIREMLTKRVDRAGQYSKGPEKELLEFDEYVRNCVSQIQNGKLTEEQYLTQLKEKHRDLKG